MEKPVTLAMKELKLKIVEDINAANMPLFLTEFILKGLHDDISKLATQQAKADEENYYRILKEEGESTVENEDCC